MTPRMWRFKRSKQPHTIDVQNASSRPSSIVAPIQQHGHQTIKPVTRVSTTVYDRIATDWWWWELASWFVSFSCVTTILSLLLYYDGRTQPEHVVRGITLNAFIAVFSGIAKAAMILPVSEAVGQLKWLWVQEDRRLFDVLGFDNASRGPLGSLMLLTTTKCKELVSLGAAITVLALAFETFFQQSVSYPTREIKSTNGTINIAASYHPINDVNYPVATDVQWQGITNGNAIRSAALEIANAISARNEPARSTPSICPTGRCTWGAYSSLAVCHRCQDVSYLLKSVSQNDSVATPGGSTGRIANPNGYHLNYTMMTGQYGLWVTSVMGLSTVNVGDRAWFMGDDILWNSTVFQKAPHVLLDFYVGFVPGGDSGIRRNVTAVLSECIFQWCVKKFEASYQNGRLDERLLSTYLPPEAEAASGSATEQLRFAPNNPFVMVAGDRTFSVGANTTRRLRNSLNANMPTYLINGSLDTTGQYPGRWSFVQNPPYDINRVVGPMADALSYHIRSSANNGTERFLGEAWDRETFVQTQWLWLLLPVILLLSSLVFISITIIRSRKGQIPSWKSSILATLLHGLTEDAHGHFISGATQSEVEALSRKVTIKMSRGRRLVPLRSPSVTTGVV